MGELVRLTAADGHEFSGYLSRPVTAPRAGLVVLQEIFGVNGHIRSVTEDFARRGYLAVAPALFDRIGTGIELGYDDLAQARETMQKLRIDDVALDVAATISSVRRAGKVGVIGYCWGGAIADLAACRTDADAAVAYYGRANVNWLNERPAVPVLYHFGGRDPLIPAEVVAQISAARPGHTVHVYAQAGHGFNCDDRPEYDEQSATLALDRSLAFFDRHLAPATGDT